MKAVIFILELSKSGQFNPCAEMKVHVVVLVIVHVSSSYTRTVKYHHLGRNLPGLQIG
jgi:hypothetical protein